MTTGPEMDALVAKHVLGCNVQARTSCGCSPGFPYDANLEGASVLPSYSTDIAAAWIVVEQMEATIGTKSRPLIDEDGRHREKGHFIVKGPYLYNKWTAGWRERDDEYWLVSAEGLTAPEAICRAALAAVGIKTEG